MKDKFLLTKAEIRDGVLSAEKKTLRLANPKGKEVQKLVDKKSEKSSDDEQFIDALKEREVQDCIVVAVE